MKPKIFKKDGVELLIEISKTGNEVILNGVATNNSKKAVRSKSFSIRDGLEKYKNIDSFEKAYDVYFSLNKIKTTLKNPKANPHWEDLKKICAPQEGEDETYHFDERSSGIYTPVLEGIAHKNPRRPTSDGYVKLAVSEIRMSNDLREQGKNEQAYRSMLRAYRLYDLASHVAYFHNAKMIKGQTGSTKAVIDNLLKLQDSYITKQREETLDKLNDLKAFIESLKGGKAIINKVENEFSLQTKEQKEKVKEKSKVIVRSLPEKIKLIKDRYNTNIKRLESLEREKSEEGIEQIRKSLSSLHELDKEKMQSLVESYDRRVDNLKKQIKKDKEILDSIGNVKTEAEKEEQIPLFE